MDELNETHRAMRLANMEGVVETQGSVSAWGLKTFGPQHPLAFATRANVEMAELLQELCKVAADPLLVHLGSTAVALAEALSARANDLQERGLLPPVSEGARERIGLEVGDVDIVMLQVATALGVSVQSMRNAKMKVNRNRRWARRVDGRYQHEQ